MQLVTIKGIYSIRNKENNKRYIGESTNIIKRFKEHKESLEQNKHHSYKLQKDYNKYGVDNFEFEILEIVYQTEDIDTIYKLKMHLVYLENFYIKKFISIDRGYNCENTMQLVLLGEKIINSKNIDAKYMKNYFKKQTERGENYIDRNYINTKDKEYQETKIKIKNTNGYYLDKDIIKYLRNKINEIIDISFTEDEFINKKSIKENFKFINASKLKYAYDLYIDEDKKPTVDWLKYKISYYSNRNIEPYESYLINKKGLKIIFDEILNDPENPHGVITKKFIRSFNTNEL